MDTIDGFKSIRLGESRTELQSRLKRWTAGEDRPDDVIYEVSMLPEDEEWGGVPMSGIKVTMGRGVVETIDVEFDHDFVLLENALRKKYGNPTRVVRFTDTGLETLSTEHDPDDWRNVQVRWEGADTVVTMDDPGSFRIEFDKKSLTYGNLKKDQDDEAAERKDMEGLAAEASKKL